MMQICDDSYIYSLKRLTEAVHEAGSRIFLQLMHAGAYAKGGVSVREGRQRSSHSRYGDAALQEENT
ncbi:MAG: hypothetical protein ACLTBV_26790 [Enterocloster bolteae]